MGTITGITTGTATITTTITSSAFFSSRAVASHPAE